MSWVSVACDCSVLPTGKDPQPATQTTTLGDEPLSPALKGQGTPLPQPHRRTHSNVSGTTPMYAGRAGGTERGKATRRKRVPVREALCLRAALIWLVGGHHFCLAPHQALVPGWASQISNVWRQITENDFLFRVFVPRASQSAPEQRESESALSVVAGV